MAKRHTSSEWPPHLAISPYAHAPISVSLVNGMSFVLVRYSRGAIILAVMLSPAHADRQPFWREDSSCLDQHVQIIPSAHASNWVSGSAFSDVPTCPRSREIFAWIKSSLDTEPRHEIILGSEELAPHDTHKAGLACMIPPMGAMRSMLACTNAAPTMAAT